MKRQRCFSPAAWAAVLLLAACLFVAVNTSYAADDLVIDGTTLTLSGEHTFENVSITNGGTLYVEPYNGNAGTGILQITAKSIIIDATSSINADFSGYRGIVNANGEGPGGGQGGSAVIDGGGGGAYGGQGGRGACDYRPGCFSAAAGSENGNAETEEIDMGSAGGAAGSRDGDYGGYGGNGGGALWLEADSINNAGTITANGQSGKLYVNDSSGGGAGGGIVIAAGTFTNSGTLRANGGSGGTTCGSAPCVLDDGGGGGSGGRIKIFYGSIDNTGNISVAGGAGALYGESGASGSIFMKLTYIPVAIDIKPGSYPNSINLDSNGNVPVAIFSTDTFDAATIDPLSVNLANATVLIKGKGTPLTSLEDVNGDGLLDLIVHVDTQALELSDIDVEAVLIGKTYNGIPVRGVDTVRVVPPTM